MSAATTRHALLAAVFAASLCAAPAPAADDARIQRLPFRDGEVVSLRGRLGYALDLELEPGERINNVAAGNLGALQIGVESHHLLIKPRQIAPIMDLIVFTDRRTYRFDYRIETPRTLSEAGFPYAVILQFPAAAAVEAAAPAPRLWHANYWYCGASELRPSEAFDDGTRTYLRYPGSNELPVPYLRETDGEERLVNAHVEGDWIIVHQTATRLVLRRGGLSGCLERRTGTAGAP